MNTTIEAMATWEQLCQMIRPKRDPKDCSTHRDRLYIPDHQFSDSGWYDRPFTLPSTFKAQKYYVFGEREVRTARWSDGEAMLEAVRSGSERWFFRYVGAADEESRALLTQFFSVVIPNPTCRIHVASPESAQKVRSLLEELLPSYSRKKDSEPLVQHINWLLDNLPKVHQSSST